MESTISSPPDTGDSDRDSDAVSPRKQRRLGVKRLLIRLALLYLVVLLLMSFLESWLVYPAPPLERSDWSPVGLGHEDVWFESEDGTRLHGWFAPHGGAKRAVLYFHGNGEQVADNAGVLRLLGSLLDAHVLIFDYRGYGKSEGRPYERGIIADGLAAQRWLADRTDRQPDQLVLVGRSLGGGVATACAAELGAEALVLQSTFTRLTDAASHHYPWLPVGWLMRNRYNSLKRIAAYEGPVFSSHGTRDFVVPFDQGETLFAAATGQPKEFFAISGGGHNDAQPPDYYPALRAFLDGLPTTESNNAGNRPKGQP